jgi:hypothetical protein
LSGPFAFFDELPASSEGACFRRERRQSRDFTRMTADGRLGRALMLVAS